MEKNYNYSSSQLLSIANIKININIYETENEPKGLLIVTHGYGEHSGFYDDLASFFTSKDFNVVAYDIRSHGLSEGKRGHVPKFDYFLDDLENVINFSRIKYKKLPVFLFGHSLGGSIVLNFLLKRDASDIKKAIISSPWLKLAFEPSKIKLFLAKLGKSLFPAFVMKGELNIEHLSRDSNFQKRFIEDPLTYDLISPGFYSGISESGIWALEHSDDLKTPVLISHGDNDMVTSNVASREFCDKAGDFCTFKEWSGGYRHVVFSENDKAEIFGFYYSYLVS